MNKPQNIDDYITNYSKEVQRVLEEIRGLVKEIAPDAQEMISYSMPTFAVGDKRFYFAANKKHIGIYAIYQPTEFEDELKPYRSTKDTVQIPLSEELPRDLIKKLINYKLID